MSNELSDYPSQEVRAEACAWMAQLETGQFTHADLEAFREWVNRSPLHAVEIKRTSQLDERLNVLTGMRGPLQQALAEYDAVLERPRFRVWKLAGAFAIITAVAILMTNVLVKKPAPVETPWPMLVETPVGGYRQVELPDGSRVDLNTQSKVEITFDGQQRVVRLIYGEALFNVAKDSARPFTVFTDDRFVQAVGTAFLVRNDDIRFEVTVTEGEVYLGDVAEKGTTEDTEVHLSTPQGPKTEHEDYAVETFTGEIANPRGRNPIVLKAGQRFVLPAFLANGNPQTEQQLEIIDDQELARTLSWQEGLLDFSETPLEEVVREVSRYTQLSIEIVDPKLRALTFGGLIRAGEVQGLFDALKSAYGVEIEYVDSTSVKLTLSREG